MPIIIEDKRRKPYVGNIPIAEAYLGNTLVYGSYLRVIPEGDIILDYLGTQVDLQVESNVKWVVE